MIRRPTLDVYWEKIVSAILEYSEHDRKKDFEPKCRNKNLKKNK